jgi:hypothetical protein
LPEAPENSENSDQDPEDDAYFKTVSKIIMKKDSKKHQRVTLPLPSTTHSLGKTFRFQVQAIGETEYKMTAFSNNKVNFLKIHPGELKQFEINHNDNTKLFFKIPSNGEIFVTKLDILQIVGLDELKDYSNSLKLEKYNNINDPPVELVYQQDYTMLFLGDTIVLQIGNMSQGLYAIKFDGELKSKDFEIVLRLSFNNLNVLDAFTSQQVRIIGGGQMDFQIPVAKSGMWDIEGYSCAGPITIYYNEVEPEFHDQDIMAEVENNGGSFEFSTYISSKKSQAIYMRIEVSGGKSANIMFNSKMGGLFAGDSFQSLSINDQVQYSDLRVAGLDIAKERLYLDLGFPLISPNLGKHYPTADYLRFSYEFYQVPYEEGDDKNSSNS